MPRVPPTGSRRMKKLDPAGSLHRWLRLQIRNMCVRTGPGLVCIQMKQKERGLSSKILLTWSLSRPAHRYVSMNRWIFMEASVRGPHIYPDIFSFWWKNEVTKTRRCLSWATRVRQDPVQCDALKFGKHQVRMISTHCKDPFVLDLSLLGQFQGQSHKRQKFYFFIDFLLIVLSWAHVR